MDFLQQDLSGFIVLSVLGLRHGLDPDHITVIDGYTYRLHLHKSIWTRWVGTLFTFGHGIMVTAIALFLCILKNNFEMPSMLDIIVEWLSSVMLLFMGISNLISLTRRDNTQLSGFRKKLLPKSFSNSLNPFTVIVTGIIFGFIFDTSSQIAAFGYAVSVSNQWIYAILGGVVFSLGLILTGTCDSLLLSKLLKTFDQKKIQSHRFKLNVLITIMCFAIPLYKIASTMNPALELSDFQNNIVGLVFISIIISLYAELYLRHRYAKSEAVLESVKDN
ncbi:HoxN/HupN/NixA family nickel/cobalt transporter [Chitinophaga filiformis]|uniref:Nickel/cobalt efflux system n=1 Tax=Chitinophaga filiformis TaxID=104663 RepID=A0A1G7LJZ7_CHIFI|nr:NAD+ synthetase [Chitinophaga filiformis]SDF49847.1 high-affinity nickel-transport protein [Chitinophaga filiformis]